MSCIRRLGYVSAAVMIGALVPSASALCGLCKSKCDRCETTSSVSMTSACGEQPCGARISGTAISNHETSGTVSERVISSDHQISGTTISSNGCCPEKKRRCSLCSWLWHGCKCKDECETVQTTAWSDSHTISGTPTSVSGSKYRCGACPAGSSQSTWKSSDTWQSSDTARSDREFSSSDRDRSLNNADRDRANRSFDDSDRNLKDSDRNLKDSDRNLKDSDRNLKDSDRNLKDSDRSDLDNGVDRSDRDNLNAGERSKSADDDLDRDNNIDDDMDND